MQPWKFIAPFPRYIHFLPEDCFAVCPLSVIRLYGSTVHRCRCTWRLSHHFTRELVNFTYLVVKRRSNSEETARKGRTRVSSPCCTPTIRSPRALGHFSPSLRISVLSFMSRFNANGIYPGGVESLRGKRRVIVFPTLRSLASRWVTRRSEKFEVKWSTVSHYSVAVERDRRSVTDWTSVDLLGRLPVQLWTTQRPPTSLYSKSVFYFRRMSVFSLGSAPRTTACLFCFGLLTKKLTSGISYFRRAMRRTSIVDRVSEFSTRIRVLFVIEGGSKVLTRVTFDL